MKRAKNRIANSSHSTPGVEGYVFDGADGSQMAFWTCSQTAVSAAHAHDFDEYMPVVEGCYTLMIGGEKIPVAAGEEYFIPRGVKHGGEVVAGTDSSCVWRAACRATVQKRVDASPARQRNESTDL
jgi:quercetin dioxygenase-like cupin family protein